jgi:hypothetical protein
MARDQSPVIPQNVVMIFSSVWSGASTPLSSLPPAYTVTIALSSLTVPNLNPATVGFPGKKIVHSTAQAIFTTGSLTVPSNASVLTALATQWATDFYSWRLLDYDKRAIGIVNWAVDGIADIEWSYLEAKDPTACMIATRASAWPRGTEPDELMHADQAGARPRGPLFAKTPGGGITAMTGTAFPYAPGSATCEVGYFDGTLIQDAFTIATVWNSTTSIVGSGGRLVQCKQYADGSYWVDVIERCS